MSQQPKGDWDIGHGLRIPALKSSDDAEALHALLDPLPGMHAVHADTRRRRLRLEYDARRLSGLGIIYCGSRESVYFSDLFR